MVKMSQQPASYPKGDLGTESSTSRLTVCSTNWREGFGGVSKRETCGDNTVGVRSPLHLTKPILKGVQNE